MPQRVPTPLAVNINMGPGQGGPSRTSLTLYRAHARTRDTGGVPEGTHPLLAVNINMGPGQGPPPNVRRSPSFEPSA